VDKIEFQISGQISQSEQKGEQKIEVTGKLIKNPEDTSQKDAKDERKSSWLKRKWDVVKSEKRVFCYWLIIILLGIDICCHISYNCVIENINYLFAIIGILATFIVVGNYMQVKDVKDEFNTTVTGIEKKYTEQRNNISSLSNQIDNKIENAIKENNTRIIQSVQYETLSICIDTEEYGVAIQYALKIIAKSESPEYIKKITELTAPKLKNRNIVLIPFYKEWCRSIYDFNVSIGKDIGALGEIINNIKVTEN
jgi:hypothetical protein